MFEFNKEIKDVILTILTKKQQNIEIPLLQVAIHLYSSIGKEKRSNYTIAPFISNFLISVYLPWQFLNFFPLPHGHGSFLPTFFSTLTGSGLLCSRVSVEPALA